MSKERSNEKAKNGIFDDSDTDEKQTPEQGESPSKPRGRPRKEVQFVDPKDEELKKALKFYG